MINPNRGMEAPTSSIHEESSFNAEAFEMAVTHCVKRLDKLITRLHRYPPHAVAVAMGVYLQGLLGAMMDERECTVDEVREFLRDVESGTLEAAPKTGRGR